MDKEKATLSAAASPKRKMKINYERLPIKAHYFFFMACE
jgi:hypothetical protein